MGFDGELFLNRILKISRERITCDIAFNHLPVDQVAAKQALNYEVNEYLGGATTSKPTLLRLEDSLKKTF